MLMLISLLSSLIACSELNVALSTRFVHFLYLI